jgi:hypothetical protein
MASFYWIKLYHELLDDPKMGLLPDNVWRRAIELFLVAGQLGQGGKLPSTAELAWRLRQNPDQLAAELAHLVEIGLLVPDGDGWLLVNFARRQGPVSNRERVRRYRERQRQARLRRPEPPVVVEATPLPVPDQTGVPAAAPDGPVTNRYPDTDTEIETETEGEGGAREAPRAGGGARRAPTPPAAVPAYKIWVDSGLSRQLSRQQQQRLDREVGRSPPALRRLGQICRAWDGLGWRKTNVSGVLDYFQRHEIPGLDRRGSGNRGSARNEIPGLHYSGSTIQKQVDLSTGRTYYWDWQRQQEVAGPGPVAG